MKVIKYSLGLWVVRGGFALLNSKLMCNLLHEVRHKGNSAQCDFSVSPRQLITDQESDKEVNQLAQFAVNEEEASHQA